MDLVEENKLISFRPSGYDAKILNQMSENNPQITSASDLIRLAIRVYDIESSDQNSKSKRLDRLEERLAALESKVELLIKLIQDGK